MSKLFEMQSEKPLRPPSPQASLRPSPEYSPDERRILLAIAHDSIASHLDGRPLAEPAQLPSRLLEPRGVFTTLYTTSGKPGDCDLQLRGCVGYVAAATPLYRAVAETARAAAFEDSRFPPVTKEEVPRLRVSLNVLSALFPIHPEAVEIGRHGLLISIGPRRGLLLPQVPVEHQWDRETFLQQTCRKAGLPLDCWRSSATIEAFTAEVFGDAESHPPS